MHRHNNCVKIQLELGHEATPRAEVTKEGFTHDWAVYVRGVDNADVHHFIEKVVFNLHESFPKPKRAVKEPPYEVRESGYASFTFPVEVYLKSKEEPRKFEFLYDLTLQTNTPVRNCQREKRYINNPSEEFRRKLIKGGGVGVGGESLPLTDNNSHNTEEKSSSRKSTSDSKKHKSKDSLKGDELRPSSQFADLFGTPIKTTKLSPSTKKSDSKHSSDKVASKSLPKHSPHKEKDKESIKRDVPNSSSSKEKDKERERNKEKDKKAEKSLKRPPSPAPIIAPAKNFKEEQKKSNNEESKEREKVKPSLTDISKNEKKDKKKDKKNRDEKDKKDRHKDGETKKEVALAPPLPPLPTPPTQPVVEKERLVERIKSEYKESKENVKKSPKPLLKEEKTKSEIKEKTEIVEKQRHKHKKKDKSKREDKDLKDKEKEKSTKKSEKAHLSAPLVKEPTPPPQPPPSKSKIRSPSPKPSKNPLSALMSELPLSDKGSESESSGDEDTKSGERVKLSSPSPPPPPPAPIQPIVRTPERAKEDKSVKEKVKKKDKKSSKDEDGSKKRKRKSKEKEEAVQEKIVKVKLEEGPKTVIEDPMDEDLDDRLSEPSSTLGSPQREEKEISKSPSPPKFTEEYVTELKDLQQKIMTLEDNAELQRVVQVIAETGQYEITKKTFDFDLCALDKSTVKRLQDLFFAAS